jgi:hypothetical protein
MSMSRALARVVALTKHLTSSEQNEDSKPVPFLHMVAFSNCGDARGLIPATLALRADEFTKDSALQDALLSAGFDAARLPIALRAFCPALHVEALGRTRADELLDTVRRCASDARAAGSGLIVHWSGHGTAPPLRLSCARGDVADRAAEVPLTALADALQAAPAVLLLLDCCHAGDAVRLARDRLWVLAACGAHELAGGWVLDGAESGACIHVLQRVRTTHGHSHSGWRAGGIMSRWFVDPVGTLFKIRHNIFCDLTPAARQLVLRIFIAVATRVVRDALGPRAAAAAEHAGPHVWWLWLCFAAHTRYAGALFRPQAPVSVPSIAAAARTHAAWAELERAADDAAAALRAAAAALAAAAIAEDG